MKRIAVDVMGGDNAPKAVIDGVLRARDEIADVTFQLYGNAEAIKQELSNSDLTRIEVINTTDEIKNTDEPVKAIRAKKDASMVVAANAVKNGTADALFSLGNTGALLAAGIFIVGRIKGIDRPALMPTLPVISTNDGFNLIDAGANASSKANYLVQWAQMATLYAKSIRHISTPRVALLNNGAEYDKGDQLHQEVYQLLKADESLNFIGNIEANEVLEGRADVIVTDGFTGNALLKSIEGTSSAILHLLKQSLLENGLLTKLGAAMTKPALKSLKTKFDTAKYGGAVLLGIKAPIVKTHGRSDARAVYYTIKQISAMLDNDIINQFKQQLAAIEK